MSVSLPSTTISPKQKMSLLLETLKAETATFAELIEGQVRSLAYVHGVLSRTVGITSDSPEPQTSFGCMDVSREMKHSCTYSGGSDKLCFQDISDPKSTQHPDPYPGYKSNKRVYVTMRFDYWGRLWMMNYDGKIYQIEDPFPQDPQKQRTDQEYLLPEFPEQPMVKFAGKMMRTDINKYFMACKLSNSTIEIFQTCPPEDELVMVHPGNFR